jgi:hypothetical protein
VLASAFALPLNPDQQGSSPHHAPQPLKTLSFSSATSNACHRDRSRPAHLLFCFAPAKWRDLSSLFISVKTQFEDKTGAKQKRPEVLLRAVLITKSLSVNS